MKYGVYGMGRIGKVHAQIVKDLGNEIVCIGDDVQAAADEALQVLSLDCPVFVSPEEMIAGCAGIEAVIIASHTKDHARHATPFVKAGIPVFLEKPLTDDLVESFDFLDAVGTHRDIIQIGLQRRYDEALCHAKDLIDRGLVGEITEIHSILRDQNPPPATYSSKGLVIDMGIHVADEVIWLLGEMPNKVWARVFEANHYVSPIDEGGNTAFVSFTTPKGVVGRLDLSRTFSSGYNNETSIIGTKGTLHVGRFCGYPGPIPVELWTVDGELDQENSRTFEMSRPEGDYPEFLPRFEKAYIESHKMFAESVADGKVFRVTQNDVLKAQVFVEAAHRSAQGDGCGFDVPYAEDLTAFRDLCAEGILLEEIFVDKKRVA